MQFQVNGKELKAALPILVSVAAEKNTMPILANVLITATDDGITLQATDLEVSATVTVPATVTENGSLTVSAKDLSKAVKPSAKDDVLSFATVGKNQLELTAKGQKHTFYGIEPDEFPTFSPMPEESWKMEAEELTDLLNRVSFAASNTESRYFLNGVYLKAAKEWVSATATDGYRLATAATAAETPHEVTIGAIIPTVGVDAVTKAFRNIKGNLTVAFDIEANGNGRIHVEGAGIHIVSRLVEGEYPNYGRLIPKDNPLKMTLDRKELLAKLPTVLRCASPILKCVRFYFGKAYDGVPVMGTRPVLDEKGKPVLDKEKKPVTETYEVNHYGTLREAAGTLTMEASSPDAGRAVAEMAYEGDALDIGFNGGYVKELFTCGGDAERVTLEMRDNQRAVVVNQEGDESWRGLLMPCRIE